jgi:inositol-phosphate transport system permease protein
MASTTPALARIGGILRRRPRTEEVPLISRGLDYTFIAALLAASLPIILSYTLLVELSFSQSFISTPFEHTRFTLENWRLFFSGRLAPTAAVIYTPSYIRRSIIDTLIVALGVTAVVVASAAPAAYAFSRMNFRGRSSLMKFLILLHAFPGVALIIGVYAIYVYTYRKLALSLHAGEAALLAYAFLYVIVARASLEVPMSTWLMKGFFDKVPWEVEWAALIDGASRLKAFWKI